MLRERICMMREHACSAFNRQHSMGIVNNSAGFRRGNDDDLTEQNACQYRVARSIADH